MDRKKSKTAGKGLRKFHYTICKYLPQIIADEQIDLATAACFRNREHAAWVSTNEFWEESANKSYLGSGQIRFGNRETTHLIGDGLARIEVNPKFTPFSWMHYVKMSKTPGYFRRAMERAAFDSGADPSEWYASFKPIRRGDWYKIDIFDWDEQCWKPYSNEVDRVFCDKALPSTRDVRPEFDEMIGLAMSKNPPFTKIYCLDTSRFGRDHHQTQTYLWTLRKKHGIDVIFANMPQTNSYLDPVFETIMSAFDELNSQQSKVKGIASMKQNIRNGWRAGGRAPFGYMLETVEVGKHRNGETISKTRLVPNPETRDVASEYFERRATFENRRSILNDFYKRGIPSPTGRKIWSPATARSLEDNIDVYLGHTVFNRHNERVKIRGKLDGYAGKKKWKDREEWVVHENTHEPLIHQKVADQIKEMKRKGIRQSPFNRRLYPLSGMLKCELCGTNYTGDRGIYRCNKKTKVGVDCSNNNISQITAEEAISFLLDQHVLDVKNIKIFTEKIRAHFKKDHSEIRSVERNLEKINTQIHKVMRLYRLGTIDDTEIEAELVP